jgi:hypothetical protein
MTEAHSSYEELAQPRGSRLASPTAGPRTPGDPADGIPQDPPRGPEHGVTCVVEVCATPWRRLVAGCLAAVVVFGGPVHGLYLPDADDLVAALKARGVRRTGGAVAGC